MRWPDVIARLNSTGEAYVLVTVIGTRGSSPRDSGSKMVVTAEHSYDTIGGGHLEFKAIARARELLLHGQDEQVLEQYPLGASLGQCCGGHVSVLFEHFSARSKDVLVFGAGHVAKALMAVLSELPLRIQWVDSREEQFPDVVPSNVKAILTDDPVEVLEQANTGSYMVVLTHNHQLDYELTEAALKRADLGFIGVIGSDTKARRFRQRLAHRGFNQADIACLTCPLGLSEVTGKRPMEVAVSIAGQIIGLYQSEQPKQSKRTGLDWKQLKQEFDLK